MALAIVNPRASELRRSALRDGVVDKLRAAIPGLRVAATAHPMHAAALARDGLQAGEKLIVAVGGDGTLNEVVNGFFDGAVNIAPATELAFLMAGTGNDFRSTFGSRGALAEEISRLATAPSRKLDVGRIRCTSANGEAMERYFINVAGFGLSGEIVRAMDRAPAQALLGGRAAFAISSGATMLLYKHKRVRVAIDASPAEIVGVSTIEICNGQYFGAGMRIAPNAAPDDGWFDIMMMTNASRMQMIDNLRKVYSGAHLRSPTVKLVRGRRLRAEALDASPVLIGCDGEQAGQLPATFEVIPQALLVRC